MKKISFVLLLLIPSILTYSQSDTSAWKLRGAIVPSLSFESGNITRTIGRLRADVAYGNTRFEINPINRLAYSDGGKGTAPREREINNTLILRLFLTKKLYGVGYSNLEYSRLRKFDYRWAVGGALAYHLVQNKTSDLKFSAGLVREATKIPAFEGTESTIERISRPVFRLIGKHNLIQDKLHFSYDVFFFWALKEATDYRYNSFFLLGIPISKTFAFNISLEDGYENAVLPRVQKRDRRLAFGFSVHLSDSNSE